MVIMALYTWQFYWFEDIPDQRNCSCGTSYQIHLIPIIGLQPADKNPDNRILSTFAVFSWHLVILVFTITQWHVYKYSSTKKKGNYINDLPKSIVIILASISQLWRKFGLGLCYVAIIALPFIVNRFSVITLLYYFFIMICLLLHMIKQHATRIIRFFWPVIVLFSGFVMLVCYVYQFPDLVNCFKCYYNETGFTNYLSLEEIGLEPAPISGINIKLLVNTIIFLMTATEMRYFLIKSKKSVLDDVIKNTETIYSFVLFIQRFFMLYSYFIATLVILIVTVNNIAPVKLIFLLLLLISFPMRRRIDYMGSFVLVYAMLLLMFTILFHFPGVQYTLYMHDRHNSLNVTSIIE